MRLNFSVNIKTPVYLGNEYAVKDHLGYKNQNKTNKFICLFIVWLNIGLPGKIQEIQLNVNSTPIKNNI